MILPFTTHHLCLTNNQTNLNKNIYDRIFLQSKIVW